MCLFGRTPSCGVVFECPIWSITPSSPKTSRLHVDPWNGTPDTLHGSSTGLERMVVSCFLVTHHGDHVCASEVIVLNDPHNHAPHKQNTQSDRMFISFAPHPYVKKHRFHRVRMVAPVCPHIHPLWTWMCHHLGYPPRVVAAWVPTQVHGVVCLLPRASCMR